MKMAMKDGQILHKRSRQCPVHNHKELGKDEVEQADADTKRAG